MTEWLLLALALLLVLACGVFVAAEFSLITVDRRDVERRAADGDRGAEGTLAALRTLSTQLSGAQLGITITNLAIGFLAEPALATLLAGPLESMGITGGSATGVGVAIAMVISTVLTMVLGELVPKNLAIAVPMRTAKGVQRLMRGFTTITLPVIKVLNGSANGFLRRINIEPTEELASARNPQELSFLVAHSAESGMLDEETAQLVRRSIDFGERRASDVMTPRSQVHSVDPQMSLVEVIEQIRESGHARFPVLEPLTDRVVGVVTSSHVIGTPDAKRDDVRAQDVMDEPVLVPATVDLDRLLVTLRDGDQQLAIVIDEFGGFDGVVTLEDLVEELTGELDDEHDEPTQPEQITPGTWRLSGLLRPDEAAYITGVLLPEHEDYETLAGLVVLSLGRMPRVGDRVESTGRDAAHREFPVTLEVEALDELRIETIALTVLAEDVPDADDPAPAGGTASGAGSTRVDATRHDSVEEATR